MTFCRLLSSHTSAVLLHLNLSATPATIDHRRVRSELPCRGEAGWGGAMRCGGAHARDDARETGEQRVAARLGEVEHVPREDLGHAAHLGRDDEQPAREHRRDERPEALVVPVGLQHTTHAHAIHMRGCTYSICVHVVRDGPWWRTARGRHGALWCTRTARARMCGEQLAVAEDRVAALMLDLEQSQAHARALEAVAARASARETDGHLDAIYALRTMFVLWLVSSFC